MNIADCIEKIYPGAESGVDFEVADRGEGQYIILWNRVEAMPSQAVLDTAWYTIMRERKSEEMRLAGSARMNSIVIDILEEEKNTFFIQETEARGWLKDNLIPTPFIDNLALARGFTKQEMVDRIIIASDGYIVATSYILGKQQGYLDLIWNDITPLTLIELENLVWVD